MAALGGRRHDTDGAAGPAGPPALTGPRHDTAVLLDADLAILGADPAAYRASVDGVRVEYRHVDDESWRRGRSAVLEGFLRRTELFHTPTARARWTPRARANLTAELADIRR